MNKFVKFPLVLGIVGLICTGALSLVYEVTKDTINYNRNKVAIELMGGIVTDITNAEPVLSEYDSKKAEASGVKNMYRVSNSEGVAGYGYLAEVTGYNPGINFLVVLDDEKILGFEIVSHSETNSGSYGGPLLNSPEFAAQFTGITFDQVGSEVDFVAGSTAKVTLNAVKTGVENVIKYHKQSVLGEADDGIKLTPAEREKLNLPEGQTMVDKTEEFKTTLKGKVSDNVYNNIMNDANIGIINYLEIVDASGAVKGYAYVAQGKYNCEVEHGSRAWQEHKFAIMFDENQANIKVVIISTGDSLGAIGKPSLDSMSWVSENFNGKTVAEVNAALSEGQVDYVAGSTFTTIAFRDHMSFVLDAHSRAYGK